MWILRKIIHPMGEIDAMEFLINKLAMTKTNDDFRDDEALITRSLPENATFYVAFCFAIHLSVMSYKLVIGICATE